MKSSTLLKRILFVDGTSSLAAGIFMIIAASPLATFMNIADPLPMILIGIGFSIFGAFVWRESRRNPPERGMVVFFLNLIYVVACWIILALDAFSLSTAGRWLILITADLVTVYAILQFVGMRQLRRPAAART
ncbi:MAG: hypothetical protein IAE80_09095 [Anaerolinea sp.]|nr:hypothetical protein [Anaerolinea sp.]